MPEMQIADVETQLDWQKMFKDYPYTGNLRKDLVGLVRPNETEDVQIVEGEDLCTLLTCTPYGINSHRLLVRGTRIENAAPALHVTSNAYRIDSLVATPVVAAPILLILLIVLMIKYRDKGSKPLISKEEDEWLTEEL